MRSGQGRRLAPLLAWLAVALAGPGQAATEIRPSEARAHVGEAVVVEGEVDNVVCSPLACLLSFEPGFAGLVIALPGSEVERFPEPKATYGGRRVRVNGTVTISNDRPRVELHDPASIEVVAGPRSRSAILSVERDAGSPSPLAAARPPVQVEAGSAAAPARPGLSARQAAVRLGLADEGEHAVGGTGWGEGERVAGSAGQDEGEVSVGVATEVRLLRQEIAALVARVVALEERLAMLDEELSSAQEMAAPGAEGGAAVGRAAPPASVVYGSTSPSLHRVKRGWTAARVRRVFGEPLEVTGVPPGPFVWHYEGGRALTVDERGRVVSSIGF